MQGVGEGMHTHAHGIRQGDEHDREHTPIMCTFASVGSVGCGDGELLSPNGDMVLAHVVSP
jgi:hypothetical protein